MENVGEIVGTGASTVFQVNSLSADILAGLALVLKIITETKNKIKYFLLNKKVNIMKF